MRDRIYRFLHGLRRSREARRRLFRKIRYRSLLKRIERVEYIRYGRKSLSHDLTSENLLLVCPDTNGFNSNLGHYFESREKIQLENFFFNPETGGIYSRSSKNAFIAESTEWPPENRLILDESPLKSVAYVEERIARGVCQTGYYHVVTEEIPQIVALRNLNLMYVQSNCNWSIAEEVYRVLGCRFMKADPRKNVSASNITFISRGLDVGYLHPKNLETLREFRDFLQLPEVPKFEKVYISRDGSRRVHQLERSKQQQYTEKGFEVIRPHEFSLLEQIVIFSGCRELVGFHGAGLVNAVWSDNCNMIEFMPINRINRCYEWQSFVCGHSYEVVLI